MALLGGVLLSASPAEAAGYRYWSFWKWADDGWTYQQQGPAVYVPRDGGVDGWRFAVSPDGGRNAARPGAPADFAAVCTDTPAQPGRKRVAVVLDFGTPADAGGGTPPGPRTACATVAPNATSAEVLAAVAPPLRYDTNGMLCAIAGYPAAGCGEQVAAGAGPAPGTTAAAATTAPTTGGGGNGGGSGSSGGTGTGLGAGSGSGSGSGPTVGLAGGGALVVVLAAGALWQTRRHRAQHE